MTDNEKDLVCFTLDYTKDGKELTAIIYAEEPQEAINKACRLLNIKADDITEMRI